MNHKKMHGKSEWISIHLSTLARYLHLSFLISYTHSKIGIGRRWNTLTNMTKIHHWMYFYFQTRMLKVLLFGFCNSYLSTFNLYWPPACVLMEENHLLVNFSIQNSFKYEWIFIVSGTAMSHTVLVSETYPNVSTKWHAKFDPHYVTHKNWPIQCEHYTIWRTKCDPHREGQGDPDGKVTQA